MMRWNSFTLRCCILALAITSVSCTGEDAGAPLIPDSANVVKRLEINHEAVMLTKNAPYDTVQLRAVPIALNGDTIPFENPVIYYRAAVRDTSVQVDSFTGMVRSRGTTGSGATNVVARLAIGRDTFYDTVRIMVRNDVNFRRVGKIDIDPAFAGDSAVRWIATDWSPTLTQWVRVYDTANNILTATQRIISIREQRPELTNVSGKPEYVSAHLSGQGYIYVRLYAHGREFLDSVLFQVVVPPVRFVVIDRIVPAQGDPTIVFYPFTTSAKVGSTIFFMNMFGHGSYHPDDDPFGFGSCVAPSSFCGNRVRYSAIQPGFAGSEVVWTDSVDINFDQPSMAMVGDSFGIIELPMRRGLLPSDGASGNIAPFSVKYCKILLDIPLNNTCGTGPSSFIFDDPPIFDPGMRSRKFMTPGTYHFSSTRYPGVSGTIIITP